MFDGRSDGAELLASHRLICFCAENLAAIGTDVIIAKSAVSLFLILDAFRTVGF
jgi:hypothetical protein